MKLLAFFLLQGLHQKPDNKSYFFQRRILEMPIFFDLFSGRRVHLLLEFLHFVDNEKGKHSETRYNCTTVGRPCELHCFQCYHMVADF
jgi:hypothetical protein